MNRKLLTALVSSLILSAGAEGTLAGDHMAAPEDDQITEQATRPSRFQEASELDLTTTRAFAAEADAVFVGEVIDIFHQVSEPDSNGVRLPFTLVTFNVEAGVKGLASGQTYTARFLGGPLGEQVLTVSEIPVFERGDRDLLFIKGNGNRGCPLVEGAHGRVQLDSASGTPDGLSPANVSARWLEQVIAGIRAAGLDVGERVSTPALDAPFVFEMPQRASQAQMRAAQERALKHNLVIPMDSAERRALDANDGDPVLPR